MRRPYLVLILAIILVSIAVFIYFRPKNYQSPTQTQKPQASQAVSSGVVYKCEIGKTAFDLLLEKYPETKFEEGSFGKFVTSIGGKEQGNGKFWLYSINEKEATIAASSYNCIESEDIIWELK